MNASTEDLNPYSPTLESGTHSLGPTAGESRRGPVLYFAIGGLIGALSAIPLVVAIPISADPNPVGYLLVLLGVPAGGLCYRIRSRNWPVDVRVRYRQFRGIGSTLALPGLIAALSGFRAQGFLMVMIGGVISLSFVAGVLISGVRRQCNG